MNRSTIARNQNGISSNMASVALANSTIVANTNDGVWFNLTSSFAGDTSTIMDSDVKRNGGDGIELGVDDALPLAKWPHGNRNNIFGNQSQHQLYLGGYHPSSTAYYAVDWTGNYWGDVYYWTGSALCLGTAPYSPGHLGYTWSQPAPGPGGLVPPPDGPLPWNMYSAGSGNNAALCGYDRFQIGTADFSRTYIPTAGRVALTATESAFVPELHYDSYETYRADAANIITDNFTSSDSNTLWTSSFGYLAASDPSYPADDLSLNYLGSTYLSSFPNSQATSSDDYIDEINNYEQDAQPLHATQPYPNRTYAHFTDLNDGGAIVQYWFFYYYNGDRPAGVGNHEGDWEMIQLHLDPSGNPINGTYSQHTSAERCEWIHVPRTIDRRPIVFVAEGSHANYFSTGTHIWDAGAVLDVADGAGEVVTPTVEDVTVSPPRWLSWPGRWGASTGGAGGQQPSPTGPAQKGEKWSNPAAWETTQSGCTEGQVFPYQAANVSELGQLQPHSAKSALFASADAPPLPRVTAHRHRKTVIIDYVFRVFPTEASRRPWALLTSVVPSEKKYPPLTHTTRIRTRRGRVTTPLGLGRGPFKLRIAVLLRSGTRSKTVSIPLR